ncbi:hypothetical protein AAF712_010191 [Marasmius tenuissimus]|uniref:MULE transposase domain-containing protein n=1 Tax=Marasmius tenuissimus TaxID=585030 RepID=A0ABR2ZP18_9AGAR
MAPQKTTCFLNISPEEAASAWTKKAKSFLTARENASAINISALILTEIQKQSIDTICASNAEIETYTFTHASESQVEAESLLVLHELESQIRETPHSKWSSRWHVLSSRKATQNQTKHVLFQCDSGYDHNVNGVKTRATPYPYTGCLAFAEVTYLVSSGATLRVRGYLKHNSECQDAGIATVPRRPLHPSVFGCAIHKLSEGIPISEVEADNQALIQSHSYPSIPTSLDHSSHRWLIEQADRRSIYRHFYRSQGILTQNQAHINIDDWLNPNSKSFNSTLAEAIFHYSPRRQKKDRLEICIATSRMKEMAWKYGHKKQVLLDGTFGICEKKMLLFILLGTDEDRHGVPLAFLLFSAPSGNKLTSSGYDSVILAKLLKSFKDGMEQGESREFSVPVASTDTDLKERLALSEVFLGIHLLLCRVHLRRCWRNHRVNVMPKGEETDDIKELSQRLRTLEQSLLGSTSYSEACEMVDRETKVLSDYPTEALGKQVD